MEHLNDHMLGLTAYEAQLLKFYEKKASEKEPTESVTYQREAEKLRAKGKR